MERSENGMFSLNLRLYPGRYEVIICPFTPNIYMRTSSDSFQFPNVLQIKFIVDGVWKNDPLRPTVHNNGHENNLLIVTWLEVCTPVVFL